MSDPIPKTTNKAAIEWLGEWPACLGHDNAEHQLRLLTERGYRITERRRLLDYPFRGEPIINAPLLVLAVLVFSVITIVIATLLGGVVTLVIDTLNHV